MQALSKEVHSEYNSVHLASIVLYLGFMQVGFVPRQVTRLTGVPYSTLNLWAKNGLVCPSIARAEGSGTERIYSFTDLVALKVAFELRKAGVTTRSLKRVVEFLRTNEDFEIPLAEARLIVSGRDVIVVKNKSELISALQNPGQGCLSFVLDLPRSLGELTQLVDAKTHFGIGILPSSAGSTRKQAASATTPRRKRSIG
jgi:DNA-binding transcriptional MerR regulator